MFSLPFVRADEGVVIADTRLREYVQEEAAEIKDVTSADIKELRKESQALGEDLDEQVCPDLLLRHDSVVGCPPILVRVLHLPKKARAVASPNRAASARSSKRGPLLRRTARLIARGVCATRPGCCRG